MRLAVLLGQPSVSTLKAQITSTEFTRWKAYMNVTDPEARADLRCAVLCACIQNMNSKSKVDPKDYLSFIRQQVRDYIRPPRPPRRISKREEVQRDTRIQATFQQWFSVLGVKTKKS